MDSHNTVLGVVQMTPESKRIWEDSEEHSLVDMESTPGSVHLSTPASSVNENIDTCSLNALEKGEKSYLPSPTNTIKANRRTPREALSLLYHRGSAVEASCEGDVPVHDAALQTACPTPNSVYRSQTWTERVAALLQSPKTYQVEKRGISIHLSETDKIYPFRGVTGLYVGFEDQISPPPEDVLRWDTHIKTRLWTDVAEFQKKIWKTKMGRRSPPGISLEFRMSGYLSKEETHVELFPRIWILYDQDRWKREVKKFVQESEWLQHEGFGSIEIRKGSPRLSTLRLPHRVEDLDLDPKQGFELADNVCIHLHVEHQNDTVANGLLCCITATKRGVIYSQRLSRIGGLIVVNGRELVTTTAHGIMELIWDVLDDDPSGIEDEESEDESVYSPDDFDRDIDLEDSDDMRGSPLGELNMGNVAEWTPVQMHSMTSFLGKGNLDLRTTGPVRFGVTRAEFVRDTDFSLFCVPSITQQSDIYDCEDASSTATSPVSIILGPGNAVQGTCLPGATQFMVHGTIFNTRKVRTTTPLALGCSGSWVVSSESGSLNGMVIACYEHEPYIHMVSVQHLLTAIGGALSHRVQVKTAGTTTTPTQQPRDLEVAMNEQQQNTRTAVAAKKLQELEAEERTKTEDARAIPLLMTASKTEEVREMLGRTLLKLEIVEKLLLSWFDSQRDESRARAMLKFKLHVMRQYENAKIGSRLKRHVSITAEELRDGYFLLTSIFAESARSLPPRNERDQLNLMTTEKDLSLPKPEQQSAIAKQSKRKSPTEQQKCTKTDVDDFESMPYKRQRGVSSRPKASRKPKTFWCSGEGKPNPASEISHSTPEAVIWAPNTPDSADYYGIHLPLEPLRIGVSDAGADQEQLDFRMVE